MSGEHVTTSGHRPAAKAVQWCIYINEGMFAGTYYAVHESRGMQSSQFCWTHRDVWDFWAWEAQYDREVVAVAAFTAEFRKKRENA